MKQLVILIKWVSIQQLASKINSSYVSPIQDPTLSTTSPIYRYILILQQKTPARYNVHTTLNPPTTNTLSSLSTIQPDIEEVQIDIWDYLKK